jgi:hypothetical protein
MVCLVVLLPWTAFVKWQKPGGHRCMRPTLKYRIIRAYVFSQGRNGIRGVHFRLSILLLKFLFPSWKGELQCVQYKLLEIVTDSILTRVRVLPLKLGLRLLYAFICHKVILPFDGNFAFDFNRRLKKKGDNP